MMHINISYTLTIALAFIVSAKAGDLPIGIDDPDVYVRLQTWKSLADDDKKVKENFNQLFEALPLGLHDENYKIRICAANAALRAAWVGRSEQKYLLSDNPTIADALVALIGDEDPEVRQAALHTIGVGFSPSKGLEDTLLTRYTQERDALCRQALLEELEMISGKPSSRWDANEPSDDVVQLYIHALDDPDEGVRTTASRRIAGMKNPPRQAIPKLVRELERSQPSTCSNYIESLARYGSDGRPYLVKELSRLEQLRSQSTNADGIEGKTLRSEIDYAIRQIQNETRERSAFTKRPTN
jgi:hypothetical protein